MRNKKILVFCYLKKNLGDDLFLSLLLARYPNETFVTRELEKKYTETFRKYSNYENVLTDRKLFGYDLSEYKACVYIGGSLFQEKENTLKYQSEMNQFIEKCRTENIPFYYISSNFGPYKSKQFYEECCRTFSLIDGITFRDKYSYNKFNFLKTVNYAPDLVLGLSIKKARKIKNSIGISMIDLSLPYRGKQQNLPESKYLNMLKENIIKFIVDGKKVYLFPFCEFEGDMNAVNKLLQMLPLEFRNKVVVKKYNGKNLYDFLRYYSKIECMICTRFHSLILSLLFRQELVVVSYNEKLDNFLNDVNFKFKKIIIDKNIDKIIIDYSWFKKISRGELKKLTLTASNQLLHLEKFLGISNRKKKLKIKHPSLKERIIRRIKKIYKMG